MIYVYFVAYSYGFSNMLGFGSAEVPLSSLEKKHDPLSPDVTHYEDIRQLKDKIIQTFAHTNVVISDYKLLRIENEDYP